LIAIIQDKRLADFRSDKGTVETEDEKLVAATIYKGRNPNVDRLIAYL